MKGSKVADNRKNCLYIVYGETKRDQDFVSDPCLGPA